VAKFTDAPWDGSTDDSESPESWCARCLIDNNPPGKPKLKKNCKLPYKTRSGAISKGALRNASSRFDQTEGGGKAAAKAKLERLKKQAGIGQDAPKKKGK
jgi:hypothetical protein